MTQLDIESTGFERGKRQLNVLRLTPLKRKRKHQKIARKAQGFSKKRITQRRGLKGTPWAKRKKKRRNRKLLGGLKKRILAAGNADQASVYFKDRSTGVIAKAHQIGFTEYVTANDIRRRRDGVTTDAMATRQQAKALIDIGFKKPKESGKGYTRASQRWIMENLTWGQAGIIYRAMWQGLDTPTKTRWKIDLPARDFLGLNRKEREAVMEMIFSDIKKEMQKR